MDKIHIWGGHSLKGTISIDGAKNAALPLMCASLLTSDPLTLHNTPDLQDVHTMTSLLGHLGVSASWDHQDTLRLQAQTIHTHEAPYDAVRKMRASVLVLGPLLSRHGEAMVSLPGGCAIGARPVDLHIRGLEALGAEVTLENGYVHAWAPKGLQGGVFTFPTVSVTGTENLLMAACLARGTTQLIRAAREPEVTDLARCLIAMGARIEGVGTDTLIIEGVPALQAATHSILPDRIETATYLMAAAITGGELILQKTSLGLLPSVVPILERMGLELREEEDQVFVKSDLPKNLHPVDVVTEPYPGFATDVQAQLMAVLTLVGGASLVTETIFENRFMHVAELVRLGADMTIQGHSCLIRGVPKLTGACVMATDLRASVSLVLAGLAAEGETVLNRIYHLDRGYAALDQKLAACGAQIQRLDGEGRPLTHLRCVS